MNIVLTSSDGSVEICFAAPLFCDSSVVDLVKREQACLMRLRAKAALSLFLAEANRHSCPSVPQKLLSRKPQRFGRFYKSRCRTS
jgi:hypothetical protein